MENSRFCRSIATTRSACCQANERPMQARMPLPNGFQLFGNCRLRRSNSPSSIRSGLKSSASLPYTDGSRWTAANNATMGVLALT